MASHSQDNPHTLSTPKMSNSPQPEEECLFLDINYALPHEELNQFRRITRAYARQIRVLSLALILPRRQKISRPVVNTPDLIDLLITEIEHPLNLISKTPIDDVSEPDNFSEEEEFDSVFEEMEDNNYREEEEGNPPQKNQPWLARDALSIPG
jgi:hypothetical protein